MKHEARKKIALRFVVEGIVFKKVAFEMEEKNEEGH
jgi:hypothetical protein